MSCFVGCWILFYLHRTMDTWEGCYLAIWLLLEECEVVAVVLHGIGQCSSRLPHRQKIINSECPLGKYRLLRH